jgi:DNA polymerase-4
MQRIILHADMNSYFASVEQQANPFLRGKAIGVTGKRQERSVVAAASREAKALGVATAMSTWEAKRILPSIILVMGDPEKYGDITARFNAIFREFTDRVEQFSVDESFLDITDTAKDYLGAIAIAQSIKSRLREECGERITVSIGIAPNKLLAKLASERMKPNGLVAIRPEQAIPFLDACDLEDFCGIGPRIRRHLESLGILNVPQLRKFPLSRLVDAFDSYGFWLHDAARGLDDSPVNGTEEEPKSMGHSYTLPRDTDDERTMKRYLLGLCDRVAWRLRRDGYLARGITAYVRYGDFGGAGCQRRFKEPVAEGLALFRIAWQLIDPVRDDTKPIRLVGLSAGELTTAAPPVSLFASERKKARLLPALDAIERRYGSHAWTRASLITTDIKERTSGFHYDHEI